MTFKGTPLFGQDSSPHYTSKVLGFICTLILWIILTICVVVIKPTEKQKKYHEVQIVLDTSIPTTSPQPLPKEVDKSQQVETQTPAPKVVEKKLPKQVAKKALPPKSKPVVEETYDEPWEQEFFDPMEQFAQQTASSSNKEIDWDEMFEDSSVGESSTSGGKVIGGNDFSGSVGTVADSESSAQRAVSKSNSSSNSGVVTGASSSTSSALGEISNATYTGYSTGTVSTESKVPVTNSSSGKVMIKMSNGRTRALLKPREPVINLSEDAAKSIDGSRIVTIKFMVTKNGNVPISRITITPASILPLKVQDEIKNQISNWIFESDNYDAFAEFEYNIVKK